MPRTLLRCPLLLLMTYLCVRCRALRAAARDAIRPPLFTSVSSLSFVSSVSSVSSSLKRPARAWLQPQVYARRSRGFPLKCESTSVEVVNFPTLSMRNEEYDSIVEDIFALPKKKTRLDLYWREHLLRLERPSARALVKQIVATNPLGFDYGTGAPKKGSLLDYVLQQKIKYPDKLILTRVGEFYETYGVDALMMIQHAGLNPMGNKAKAGTPIRNLQATLDSLTVAGISVCVYEELPEVDVDRTSTLKARIKRRALTQIVSPGSSTYMYDLCLRSDAIEFRPNRPYVGITSSPGGYCLCQAFVDERVLVLQERLTAEALRVCVDTDGYVEPIYVQDLSDELPFLPDVRHKMSGYSREDFCSQVLRDVGRNLEIDVSDFRIVRSVREGRPRSLYTSTANQIGLLPNPNIPDLISNILPKAHNVHSARFLRRWILNPPPYTMADSMHTLCKALAELPVPLPMCVPVPVGKVVALISFKQCNSQAFNDIAYNVEGMLAMLGPNSSVPTPYESVVQPLLNLTSYESGIDADREVLRSRLLDVLTQIRTVVADADARELDAPSRDPHELVPDVFFERNEEVFRKHVLRSCPDVEQAYQDVEQAARHLCEVVDRDFPRECEITHDIFNNAIMLKRLPDSNQTKYIQPMDRNRKPIPRRYTTAAVESSLSSYWVAVDAAVGCVRSSLMKLSETLHSSLPSVVQASHWAVIVQAAALHTACALQKGWVLPVLEPYKVQTEGAREEGNEVCFDVKELRPYWLNNGQTNTFRLKGVYLLTAPNMSGKSTLMRSACVAALLANCGLFVPCKSLMVPRYDTFFLRTSSHDIPSEGKSAFALEMDDVRVMLRDCSAASLVMIDELGKGTSAKEGSALAGALLETLDRMGVSGIFATHLHELFSLPLDLTKVTYKRMGVAFDSTGRISWTYRLEDGKCTDSLALFTAKTHGIPFAICERAEVLSQAFDRYCRAPVVKEDPGQPTEIKEISLFRNIEAGYTETPVTLDLATNFESSDHVADVQAVAGLEEHDSGLVESASKRYNLEDLTVRMQQISGSRLVSLVENQQLPPVAFEGKSCVYVLHIVSDGLPDTLYVGETESIAQRLVQHRRTHKSKKGNVGLRCLVAPAPNKSAARAVECALIGALKGLGYDIQQDSDQYHRLFSQG